MMLTTRLSSRLSQAGSAYLRDLAEIIYFDVATCLGIIQWPDRSTLNIMVDG